VTRGLVIFDGDDTLWLVEPLYDEARDAVAEVVASAGLDPARWKELQRHLDVENVSRLGVSTERFPTSCLQAYRLLTAERGASPRRAIERRVWDVASSVFDRRAVPVDGAHRVLDALRPHCSLALLTKGEGWVQEKRIADAGLEDAFDDVSIAPTKDERDFAELLTAFDLRPTRAWSVGNSLASDINPALRRGMNAVWIDAHVWEHERRENEAVAGHLVVVEKLSDVPEIILGSGDRVAQRS
jgi:putative hydrolase of the HAD superfamily